MSLRPSLCRLPSRPLTAGIVRMRIFIADDNELVRRGILDLLAEHIGHELYGEGVDSLDVIEKAS